MQRLLLIFSYLLLTACAQTGPLKLYPGASLPHDQEARLILPIEYELLSINHQAVEQSQLRFRVEPTELRLAPGPTHITVKYKDVFDISSDQHETVESGKLSFELVIKPQQTYTLGWPTINGYEDAVTFVNKPKLYLKNGSESWLARHQAKPNPLILKRSEATHSQESIALEKLGYWWQQASDQERTEFLNRINNAKKNGP
ncbi:DUF2057 family protein [Bermanella sp. R86510]|uniref:DUF2057 family protein n=1 Tax=unclassified Bermanella TaxID=2627862 RepID=UPI0037C8BD38